MLIRQAKLPARTLVVILVIGFGLPRLSASPIRPGALAVRGRSPEPGAIALQRWSVLDWGPSSARPGGPSRNVHVWLCGTTRPHAGPDSWVAPAPIRPAAEAVAVSDSDREVRLPEPASLVIVLAGSIGLVARRWLQQRQD